MLWAEKWKMDPKWTAGKLAPWAAKVELGLLMELLILEEETCFKMEGSGRVSKEGKSASACAC